MPDEQTDQKASWSRALRFSADVIGIVPIIVGLGGFVRAAIWEEGSVTAALAFTPGFAMQLYAALAAGGALLLARMYWPWFQSLLPSTRFGRLAEHIGKVLQKTVSEYRHVSVVTRATRGTRSEENERQAGVVKPSSYLEANLRDLSYRLDSLRIPHPDVLAVRDWNQWLPELWALAKTKRLRAARRSWKKADA